jgi:hypothetical protein
MHMRWGVGNRIIQSAGLLGGLTLVGNRLESLTNSLFISEVVVLDRLEVGIQLIDEGDTRGDVQLGDLRLRNIIQILDQSTDRVTVSGDDDTLTGLDGGGNVAVPEGNETSNSILQGLSLGDLLGLETSVAAIVAGPVLGGLLDLRRGDIVAATPDFDLLT